MLPLVVRYPITDLDNRLLLPAGTVLTDEVIDALIASNTDAPYEKHSFLSYGAIRSDLRSYLVPSPFRMLFDGQEGKAELLGVMEQVSMISPFFRVLDRFKQLDPYTYRHMLVVYALSRLLHKDLIPDAAEWHSGLTTSYIHDIGKINLPLQILNKPTPLTPAERDRTMHHTIAGHVMSCYYLRDSRQIMALIERDHHERRNGSGHPRGIQLDNLLVEIVAVCDVYDALVSSRPYRRSSYSNRGALEVLTEMAEKEEISWDIVRALMARNRKSGVHYTQQEVSTEKRCAAPSGNNYGILAPEEDGSKDAKNNRG
jgi:HD-GYP domain-containing protein (c-di-GMP phosphodiesterase class II)